MTGAGRDDSCNGLRPKSSPHPRIFATARAAHTLAIAVYVSVDDVRDRGFCLTCLFLEPFLVTGHGFAQTAAKEMRSLPSFDAFCLKNTEHHPGYLSIPVGLLAQSRPVCGEKPPIFENRYISCLFYG